MSRFTRVSLWATAAAGALFGLSFFPICLGLFYVGRAPVVPLLMLLLACACALFWSLFLRFKGRVLLRVLCGLLIAASLAGIGLSAYLHVLFRVFQPEFRVEHSPSGKHSLVVIESGFIDAAYTAHPMANAFFYRYTDDGFISYHDFWGGVDDAAVEWLSDTKARVWVPGGGGYDSEGSAEEIVVRFE